MGCKSTKQENPVNSRPPVMGKSSQPRETPKSDASTPSNQACPISTSPENAVVDSLATLEHGDDMIVPSSEAAKVSEPVQAAANGVALNNADAINDWLADAQKRLNSVFGTEHGNDKEQDSEPQRTENNAEQHA